MYEGAVKLKEFGMNIVEDINDPTVEWFVTQKLKYPLEKHIYTTTDGYINTVFRIPGT